jgi:hypothetical protein
MLLSGLRFEPAPCAAFRVAGPGRRRALPSIGQMQRVTAKFLPLGVPPIPRGIKKLRLFPSVRKASVLKDASPIAPASVSALGLPSPRRACPKAAARARA